MSINRIEQAKTSFDRHPRNETGTVAIPVGFQVSEIVYPFYQFGA